MAALIPELLTADRFKPYGDVIELAGATGISINSGNCQRYSDLASLDIDSSGSVGISLFDAKAYSSPLSLRYVERHPLGSQAFMPMCADKYLVVVADDNDGIAHNPQVFITDGTQGVNYKRNTWHGVLTPIIKQCQFTVVDYIGSGANLEEYFFESAHTIEF